MNKIDTIELNFNVNETQMNIEVLKGNLDDVTSSFNDEFFLDDKPGVYCFYDDKRIYIGESAQPLRRLTQHIKSRKFKHSYESLVFRSDKFNKSAIYDIETELIQYLSTENKYKLINERISQDSHNYFMKESYEVAIEKVWEFLISEGVGKYKIPEIEIDDKYRLSPFKALNSDQANSIDLSINANAHITLIKGYPGTGKSIVASRLFYELVKDKKVALTAGTQEMVKSFKNGLKIYKKENGSKIKKPLEIIKEDIQYDFIIVDEAHRLYRKSSKVMPDTVRHLQENESELDLLIKKCNKIIILYDHNQKVHDKDFHFDESIIKDKQIILLREQMRMNHGANFMDYVIRTFHGFKTIYKQTKNYDVRVFKTFTDMYTELRKKANEHELVRLLSGFTRKWKEKSKKENPENDYDFDIEGFKLNWNSRSADWIHSDAAKELKEVAYYSKIQGFDLNYAGVIIGKDLYLDKNGEIQINEKYVVHPWEKPLKSDPKYNTKLRTWVLNRYKILLSRGVMGTYIYCEDSKLANKLMEEINGIGL